MKVKKKIQKVNKLSLQQEEFCQLYISSDRELYGNGTNCYIEAYKPDKKKPNWYNTARACASRMLTRTNIINRINELLEEQGFNDENVEKQHLFLLNQHNDLKTKMKAVDHYYKLKGKYAPEEKKITGSINLSELYDKANE